MREAELRGGRLGDRRTGIRQQACRRPAEVEADAVGGEDRIEGAAVGDVDLHRAPLPRVDHALAGKNEGGHRAEADDAGLVPALPPAAGGVLHLHSGAHQASSEERREGKEWVRTCRSRWSASHEKKNRTHDKNTRITTS